MERHSKLIISQPMLRFLVISALVASAFGNSILLRTAPSDGRIVGGKDTTIEKHPHQVLVKVLSLNYCGGSIIGPRIVLTAAHCSGLPTNLYKVQHGVTSTGTNVNLIDVEKVIKHPGYNSETIDNDVAILVLAEYIAYGPTARPIQIAKIEPKANAKAVVTGWGNTQEAGSASIILQEVDVRIIAEEICNKAYGGITKNMVCAGMSEGGKDACQGDSGGPLVCDDQLVGVVSYGVGCAQKEFPGVYANVATLSVWIESQLKIYG